MAKTCLLVGVCFVAGLVLCACGDSQESSLPYNRTLGGVKEGAPLVSGTVNPGILQDPSTYQPTKLPAGAAGAADAGPGATAKPARPETQVLNAARQYAAFVRDGEFDLLREALSAAQAGPLADLVPDAVFDSYEKTAQLARLLRQKAGKTKADMALKALRPPSEKELKVSLADPARATVTPGFLGPLFGTAKKVGPVTLTKAGSDWKIQLDPGLTASDVGALTTYHEKLSAGLDAITQWVTKSETIDAEKLQAAIEHAVKGEPVDLPGIAEATPAKALEPSKEDEGGESPAPQP